jgi:hypothetical protein
MKLRALTLSLAVGAALLFGAAGSFARHCPEDMKKIDAALAKNPKLSDAQMSEVKKLRAEGEKLHKAGDHPASEDALAKAMKILGI